MSSRLDRLFLLLENGSTPLIRKTAALQLGEVQRLYPHKLHHLLDKILRYLLHNDWDTRIAASQAITSIIKNLPKSNTNSPLSNVDSKLLLHSQIKLNKFNIDKILEKNIFLLSSEGIEYDAEEIGHNDKSSIEKQKTIFKEKLSFHPAVDGFLENSLIEDEDFKREQNEIKYRNVDELKEYIFNNFLSSFEINYCTTTNGTNTKDTLNGDDEPSLKLRKIDSEVSMLENNDNSDWSLKNICNELAQNLFNASWQRRHGAAIGLREIIKVQGAEAAHTCNMTVNEMRIANQIWLQDICIQLLCVLTLDRFSDFVSDEMVAPVRESCGQALGAVLHHMDDDLVPSIVRIGCQMLHQPHWQVRHAGLLALKYLIAVKQNNLVAVMDSVLPDIIMAMGDAADDVRSMAATCLLPAVQYLATRDDVNELIQTLRNALKTTDELAASSHNVMLLLSQLLSSAHLKYQSENWNEMVPLLWPFLDHNMISVRKAVVVTFKALVAVNNANDENKEIYYKWVLPILPELMTRLFQRSLLETNNLILREINLVWDSLLSAIEVGIMMTSLASNFQVWLTSLIASNQEEFFKQLNMKSSECNSISSSKDDVELTMINCKVHSCRLLGTFCKYVSVYDAILGDPSMQYTTAMCQMFDIHLATKSAVQRLCVASVVKEWTSQTVLTNKCLIPDFLHKRFIDCLTDFVYFDEVAPKLTCLFADCRKLVSMLGAMRCHVDGAYINNNAWTFGQIENLISCEFNMVKTNLKTTQLTEVEEFVSSIQSLLNDTKESLKLLSNRVQCAISSCLITLNLLPEKLNPVIRPLMDSVQSEENLYLQRCSSLNLSQIIFLCLNRDPCPTDKILKKIIQYLYSDNTITPHVSLNAEEANSSQYEIIASSNTIMTKNFTNTDQNLSLSIFSEAAINTRMQQRGSSEVMRHVVTMAADHLITNLPFLFNYFNKLFDDLKPLEENKMLVFETTKAQEIVNRLQVFQNVIPYIHADLYPQVLEKLAPLAHLLWNQNSSIRHMAARCICVIGGIQLSKSMEFVFTLLPWLKNQEEDFKRLGAVELYFLLLEYLDLKMVPYLALLVVPILASMTDRLEPVRLLSSTILASLIKLLPLEKFDTNEIEMSEWMQEEKKMNSLFISQLLDVKTLQSFTIPAPINMQLRKYQQDGVDWLAFLCRYNLHGILCDDMGLGKTLQTICILLAQYYEKNEKINPSLVICPTTLTAHWFYEVEKTVNTNILKPLLYSGAPNERLRLQRSFDDYNLLIASYDAVRNDIDYFIKINWNYCILDEGHIIKNSKTKLFKAIKMLSTSHRLILSGTPIQNNVLEVWSLFDFLMPGFLGSERQFKMTFGKPILASRDPKSSPKLQEAGTLALESLHRQVLPFVLRRMKEDVLSDLPPKIIQDYICNLTPLQIKLYEDFASILDGTDLGKIAEESVKKSKSVHIFQALQYLRKVCNHPCLVLSSDHPQRNTIFKELALNETQLASLSYSTKLVALKQLLLDCGIGNNVVSECENAVVNQHRVLLFSQMKNMLDIIEQQLFKNEMPGVTYLRIDGGVPSGERFKIVTRFNNDPSIDILLLTTHVGGLGLNLTGADTVIFYDHDWNPTKDLQAMDRAHRIGQKKVVTVYRLITRGTLEEKIMNLQKFKLNISNCVINEDNMSLGSMDTHQLFDLFSLQQQQGVDQSKEKKEKQKATGGLKAMLDNLEELWDTQQYDKEFDLGMFLSNIEQV